MYIYLKTLNPNTRSLSILVLDSLCIEHMCTFVLRTISESKLKINRGSYMSANVLLNLLNEFPSEVYKFSTTGTRMQDSFYHMTLK